MGRPEGRPGSMSVEDRLRVVFRGGFGLGFSVSKANKEAGWFG